MIVVVAVLAVSNVMTNEVLPWAAYLPWNLVMTAVLLWIALRVDTTTPDQLGLERSGVRRGALVGGIVLLVISVVLLVAALLPATRALFEDERVAGTSVWAMLYQVLVRIPLGTVVLEEVAFRGVLLGMLLRRTSRAGAVMVSSVLFGLWHVLPAIGVEGTNPVLADLFGGTGGAVAAVVLAVVGTAIAGVALCIVRFVGHSLLAPMLAHVATNSVGFVVAWFVIRAG
ncbi:MAG: CPBP family intramembrane metalloprotease [Ilumatobacter sp.]|nr:MAG: CPBP family intramembrane metalloprotease [Ilumatobacter sp.]